MNKKGQATAFLVLLMTLGVVLGAIDVYLYYQRIQLRSCASDFQCGTYGFCDENQKCQFPEETIVNQEKTEIVNKHNTTWGLIFAIGGIMIAVFLMKPKKIRLFGSWS